MYLAGVHKRRGELYAAKGNPARALVEYEAFIQLWANADAPPVPLTRLLYFAKLGRACVFVIIPG